MKKIISVTLALSMIGNVAFANGTGSEVVDPIKQAEEVLSDLESRINETVVKYSAIEDKLIEIEIEKHQLDLIEQQHEIRELNKKIKERLEIRDAYLYGGMTIGTVSATVYALVIGIAKKTKNAHPENVEILKKALNNITELSLGIFAAISVAGATNEYLIFETREELVEFQELIQQTELKLQKEIEALNQN